MGNVVALAEAACAALMRAPWLLFALIVAPFSACGPVTPTRPPPPLAPTPEVAWQYGAQLLSLGEAAGARRYLEQVGAGPLDNLSDGVLFLRDLAEARLFSDDLPGAAAAANQARVRLVSVPRSAQFQADDRLLMERTIDDLEAAAQEDTPRLGQLASDEAMFPSADAWYLLGWLAERRGDVTSARSHYRAFLDRAPQWTFLRRAVVMQQYAQSTLR
ncbi:MAG: hypothetical protein LC797_12315 [Chloroflexi bacterium]|nr:hypothetical protein [Chloroflexota bacterium]